MLNPNNSITKLGFLQDGGEMGELIRNFDWEKTSLGKTENWPLSLCTTVGIALHSAFPQFLFWGKDLISFYNDPFRPSLGIEGKHPAIGKKGQEIWPEIWEFIGPLIEKVMNTGEAVWFEDQLVPFYRNGKIEDIYWTFSYSPAYGDDGEVAGVFVTCTETTSKVKAIAQLEESKNRLQFAIDAAELATWELNPITSKFRGNDRLKEWFGLRPDEEIELSLAINVIAEKDREQVNAAIAYALKYESGGLYDIEYTIQNQLTGKETIVKAKGKAYFDDQKQPYTFRGTLQDVTVEANARKQLAVEVVEQLKAKSKLEESELFSQDVFYNSPVAKLVFTGEEMTIAKINENMLNMLGRDQSIVGKSFIEAIPELQNTFLMDRLREVLATGKTFNQPEEKIDIIRFGKPYTGYYNYIYKPLVSTSNEIYGVMVTATEVTEQVIARQIIEEKEKELRDLIIAAPIGICVLHGIEAKIEEVNDRFVLISGKRHEQYMNATYWEVFPEVAEPFAPILENVFKTGIKFTSEETEMVLIRSGKPERIYATFDYIPVLDNNNEVTKIIVIVIEVTHQAETRKQIEEAVINRTKELAESNLNLKRSNEQLEQFAYIASHDLQEPIRKISTFTEMLEQSIPDLSDKSKSYISKIYGSTDRMTKLIRDILVFSQISQEKDSFEKVDLKKIVQSVEMDFELLIEQTKATMHVSDLPVMNAIPSQMTQLFGNLLSNSLKYSKINVPPVIHITYNLMTHEEVQMNSDLKPGKSYFKIIFKDNGIGFNEEYVDRIFNIFQRLHGKTEYAGTGVGLAICKKIAQNHHGSITGLSKSGDGAEFHIILPKNVMESVE